MLIFSKNGLFKHSRRKYFGGYPLTGPLGRRKLVYPYPAPSNHAHIFPPPHFRVPGPPKRPPQTPPWGPPEWCTMGSFSRVPAYYPSWVAAGHVPRTRSMTPFSPFSGPNQLNFPISPGPGGVPGGSKLGFFGVPGGPGGSRGRNWEKIGQKIVFK